MHTEAPVGIAQKMVGMSRNEMRIADASKPGSRKVRLALKSHLACPALMVILLGVMHTMLFRFSCRHHGVVQAILRQRVYHPVVGLVDNTFGSHLP